MKMKFEIPSRKPLSQEIPNLRVLRPFWLMMLLEPEVNEKGDIIGLRVMKAFKRESMEDKLKHQKQEQPKETLDSFVDDNELI